MKYKRNNLVVDGFNVENSPLLSNEVMDVAFDANRNLAYVATSLGVNTIKIPFGKSRVNYSDVIIFPSPFFIPSQKSMKVDNLPFNSSMLITTLNGKIIKNIATNWIILIEGEKEKLNKSINLSISP